MSAGLFLLQLSAVAIFFTKKNTLIRTTEALEQPRLLQLEFWRKMHGQGAYIPDRVLHLAFMHTLDPVLAKNSCCGRVASKFEGLQMAGLKWREEKEAQVGIKLKSFVVIATNFCKPTFIVHTVLVMKSPSQLQWSIDTGNCKIRCSQKRSTVFSQSVNVSYICKSLFLPGGVFRGFYGKANRNF